MPAAAQTPEDEILALAKGAAEVRRFIAAQQRKQQQVRAEMEWRRRRRQELLENLAELSGFKHPVVSLQRVVTICDDASVHAAAIRMLKQTLTESEAKVRKAEVMLPNIEARRARALREAVRGVVLEFRR